MSMPFFRSKRFATNTETIQTLVDGAPSVPTVSFGSWVWPKPDSGAVKAKDQRTATAARQKRLVTLVRSIVKKPVTDAGKIYREPSQSVKDGSAEGADAFYTVANWLYKFFDPYALNGGLR